MLRTIILITRGIILDPRSRRWAMFVLLLAALVMLFAGFTFLPITTPMAFLVYWGVCAWLTFAALLLALWDILLLRAGARKARRKLEKQILKPPPDE
jgi:membrane protein implicated in regulation of membrane protease activity